MQSAWEHHRALIRCICTIGGAVDSIEYLKKIQYGGMDERMKDIRACLEGHKVGVGLLCLNAKTRLCYLWCFRINKSS